MSKIKLDENKLEKALRNLKSIRNPKRLEIIKMLTENPKLNVTQIYTELHIIQADASYNLKILRNIGVVNYKRNGHEIYYSINKPLA